MVTSMLGWWWINSFAALALVYNVVKEGSEAVEEARGKPDANGYTNLPMDGSLQIQAHSGVREFVACVCDFSRSMPLQRSPDIG